MNLWIRSQNKEELVLATRIYLLNTYIRAIDFKGYSLNIGIYESKERAIEIIDEIQNKLQDKFLCKPTALLKPENLLKQEYELYEKYKKDFIMQTPTIDIEPINCDNVIYEMPKE